MYSMVDVTVQFLDGPDVHRFQEVAWRTNAGMFGNLHAPLERFYLFGA
jgi:hypothetical protein